MKNIAIMLAGRKMVGKTTAAEYIKNELAGNSQGSLKVRIYGYAHQIKDIAKVLGIDEPNNKTADTSWMLSDLVNDLQPNVLDRRVTVREMLQDIGMALRDHLSHMVWHKAMYAKIFRDKPDIVIVDDVRLADELSPPPGFEGVPVRISRPSLPKNDNHVTETEIDEQPAILFQYELINDGSLDQFKAKLDRFVADLLRRYA